METFKKLIIFIFTLFIISCNNDNDINTSSIIVKNKYKTVIRIHYSTYYTSRHIFYTDNKVTCCSFNGTNYLIENNKEEELLSTTAPIEIISQSKFDNNGIETQYEFNYFKE